MSQCTATAKSTGERCQRDAIKGAEVCHVHGGAASQVQEKAQERLDRMADSVTADMQDKIDDFLSLYDDADPDEKADLMREARQLWTEILDRTGHGRTERRELTGEDGGPVETRDLSAEEKEQLDAAFDTEPDT
jgi:hypothetical protein